MWIHIPKQLTSRFFPGSGCSIYQSSLPYLELSACLTASGKARLPRFWRTAWGKAIWTKHLSTPTCEPSQADSIVAEWLESLAGSPAKTSASPVAKQASPESAADCSSTSSDSFANWNPSSGCFLKTSRQCSLFQQDQPYSENLPRSGSMRNGELFERPMLARRIDGTGRLSSPIEDWRTPNTRDHHAQGPRLTAEQRQFALVDQVDNWPTPRGTDGTNGGPNQAGSRGDLMLPSAAAQWATPNARDEHNPSQPDSARSKRKLEQGWTIDLNEQAAWWAPSSASSADTSSTPTADATAARIAKESARPTPASRDHKGANSESHMDRSTGALHLDQLPNFVEHCFHPDPATSTHGAKSSPSDQTSRRRLNPAFVEWLMALPHGWTDFAPVEMESWRSRAVRRLSLWLNAQGYSRESFSTEVDSEGAIISVLPR